MGFGRTSGHKVGPLEFILSANDVGTSLFATPGEGSDFGLLEMIPFHEYPYNRYRQARIVVELNNFGAAVNAILRNSTDSTNLITLVTPQINGVQVVASPWTAIQAVTHELTLVARYTLGAGSIGWYIFRVQLR